MVPVEVSKKAMHIEAYHYDVPENERKEGYKLPDLLFITCTYHIEVYASPLGGGDFDIPYRVAYLSANKDKKDIAAIDTTMMWAGDGIILLGNKTGNITCWEIKMGYGDSADKFKI